MIEPSDFKTKSRGHAAFGGPEIRFGDAEDGAAEMDLTPLTNNNCLMHLVMAESKRSMMSSSFLNPSNVVASPSSTNL